MSPALLGSFTIGLVLAGATTGIADALTVPELQRLLQSVQLQTVPFHELRESPWLVGPVESRGTMDSTSARLEKRVAAPRQETWRFRSDRMEWIAADGVTSKQIMFSDAPGVALLAVALRRVVAGDLLGLEHDFSIELQGDERRWTVRLVPRVAEAARFLDNLEMSGAGGRLQVIVVVERSGERTTTRLYP